MHATSSFVYHLSPSIHFGRKSSSASPSHSALRPSCCSARRRLVLRSSLALPEESSKVSSTVLSAIDVLVSHYQSRLPRLIPSTLAKPSPSQAKEALVAIAAALSPGVDVTEDGDLRFRLGEGAEKNQSRALQPGQDAKHEEGDMSVDTGVMIAKIRRHSRLLLIVGVLLMLVAMVATGLIVWSFARTQMTIDKSMKKLRANPFAWFFLKIAYGSRKSK